MRSHANGAGKPTGEECQRTVADFPQEPRQKLNIPQASPSEENCAMSTIFKNMIISAKNGKENNKHKVIADEGKLTRI